MKRLLSEKEVLKKLKIKDFRHLTKSNIINFASMLDKMDPEVAKKALEQFPEFAKNINEFLTSYKEVVCKGIESNNNSIQNVYNTNNQIIDSLTKQLDKDNIPTEERKFIIEKIVYLVEINSKKDSENKKFIIDISHTVGFVVMFLGACALAAIGANPHIEYPTTNNSKENTVGNTI